MKKVLSYLSLVVLFVLGFVTSKIVRSYYKEYNNTKLELQECKIYLDSVKSDETLKKELQVCSDTVNVCEEKFSQCVFVVRYLYKQNADLKGAKNGK